MQRDSLLARLRRGVVELFRFSVVGLVAFVLDVTLFNALVHVGDPPVLQDKPLTAKTLSVVAATVLAYWLNREWTWKHRSRRGFWREYSLYFLLNGIGLALTLLPLAVSRYVLGLDSALADNLSANVVGLAAGTLFRFWSYRRWVFPVEGRRPETA